MSKKKETKKETTKSSKEEPKFRCGYPTKDGTPCKRVVKEEGQRCHIHKDKPLPEAEPVKE